jgi:undecaprenyl-diphosphatase
MTSIRKQKLIVINILGLSLFAAMLYTVCNDALLTMLDQWISTSMPHVRRAWLDPVVTWITDLNGMTGAGIFSVVLIGIFVWKRWTSAVKFYLITVSGAAVLFIAVKMVVVRSRPEASIIEIGGYSFPSGHTTMATAMAFGLYFILSEWTKDQKVRAGLFLIALGWALLIAVTRVYLGVHWLTDVVGGFGLGIWWVTLVRLLYREKLVG